LRTASHVNCTNGRSLFKAALSLAVGLFHRAKTKPPFWFFFVLLFFGVLIWAHSCDPFRRAEFSIKMANGDKVHGITVLPIGISSSRRQRSHLWGDKTKKLPVVVYAHGAGESSLTDGKILREFAGLGMAAVDFDYEQSKQGVFANQFSAVLAYVRRQPWADTNAIAWVAVSQGAQDTLACLLDSARREPVEAPIPSPSVYVRISGGWVEGNIKPESRLRQTQVLLVHGKNDQVFPLDEMKRVAGLLRSNAIPVSLAAVPGHGHGFEADRMVISRLVAEYCKAKLTPKRALPEYPKPHPYPVSVYIIPAFGWVIYWWCFRRRTRVLQPKIPFADIKIGFRIAVCVLGILALGNSALRLILPRMKVTPFSLMLAREYLVAPGWRHDFESLAILPAWHAQQLRTLLTHAELAHYTAYELANWRLDDMHYRQYVLSPIITGAEQQFDWRYDLWESFYPQVRHEDSTSDAAEVVSRFLRELVTITPNCPKQPDAQSMWSTRIVSSADFDILYVAALRSVAVPARLNASGETEFWTGQDWHLAPPPLAITLSP
jgi:predicted esterase